MEVIQPLETRTPMAAIFSSPTHTPVSPGRRPGYPNPGADERLLESRM